MTVITLAAKANSFNKGLKVTPINPSIQSGLAVGDWIIVAFYLALILGLGVFVYLFQMRKKQHKSSSHFFTGGGNNPVIVVGLSMWATITSSLFFVNITGQVITGAWMWVGPNIALIGITPFIAMYIIPFYRRLKESTAYAFLQKRFHYSLRALNSLSFIMFQIFRTSVVLFVPIVVLTAVVDVNPYLLIAIVGAVVILMTAFGGFKAVIWADAIQGLVLLFGIVCVLIFALAKTDFGSSTFKFQEILTRDSWKVSLAGGGITFLFIYNIINSMYAYMGSQDVTQRYKGTKNIYQIRKTLYISSLLGIISVLLFFGAGSAMYSYYTSVGASAGIEYDAKGVAHNINTGTAILKAANSGGTQNVFLISFVSQVMGVGFVGVILASIFAASQSTISSGLSALSNSIIVDFIEPFTKKNGKKGISDAALTWISRIIVMLFGSLAILFGMVLIYVKQDDLLNYFTGFVGLLNAPTVAVFVLGIFSKRANWLGVLIGMTVGFAIGIPLWLLTQKFVGQIITFHGIWLTFTTFFSTLIIGYILSLLTNNKGYATSDAQLVNRTMLTRTKEFKQLTRLESQLGYIQKLVHKKKLGQQYLQSVEEKIASLEKVVVQQSI